jgi:hypothetical protein
MRRRTLLTVAGQAVPAHLVTRLDETLAVMPASDGPDVDLGARLLRARGLFDAGEHARLLGVIPGLLAAGHAAARSRDEVAYARLSSAYSLTTNVLTKIGRHPQSRITADRAVLYADLAGSPVSSANAARVLSIVLRHQGQPASAQRVITDGISGLEATGLRTPAQSAAYAQMLCTTSYTAARAGDRELALEMIQDAKKAACRLPEHAPTGAFPVTPAAVTLYAVGVHWALGDAGAALHAGRSLTPEQFPTAERRGRLHTDLARAWWQWGKPEQTAHSLLDAYRAAPSEVRDRPTIRDLVTELARRHPRAGGVRELAGVVLGRSVGDPR